MGLNLAFTGAVKDDILDVETLGCHLMAYLGASGTRDALAGAYKLPRHSGPGGRRRTTWPGATACWRRREGSGAF